MMTYQIANHMDIYDDTCGSYWKMVQNHLCQIETEWINGTWQDWMDERIVWFSRNKWLQLTTNEWYWDAEQKLDPRIWGLFPTPCIYNLYIFVFTYIYNYIIIIPKIFAKFKVLFLPTCVLKCQCSIFLVSTDVTPLRTGLCWNTPYKCRRPPLGPFRSVHLWRSWVLIIQSDRWGFIPLVVVVVGATIKASDDQWE